MNPFAFAVALFVSAILTRLVRDLANARGWNPLPASERHIHTRPIPRLGGVAIFLSLWCISLMAWVAGHFNLFGIAFPPMTFKIMGPATIIFAVGLIDDFCDLRPYVKFVAQIGAAVVLFSNGFGISRLSLLANHPHLNWLVGLPLTVLWVVWITNALNLIDGLDGLAAGSALFSTIVTCIAAICFHSEGVLLLSLALAGAIAGFLLYNFNPASIFLGDCGSLLIGFLLSALALAGSQKAPTVAAVAIPVVSLGLPILDMSVAVLRRFLNYKALFHADREHIHHKLLGRGVSHKQSVFLLYGVSACFGMLSLFLLHPAGALVFTVLTAIGVGAFLGLQQLGYLEFLELGRVATRALKQRRVIANDLKIRRSIDSLRRCKSVAEFTQIMQQCLKPAGLDGFGLYLMSEVPVQWDVYPFRPEGGSQLRFLWNRSLRLAEAGWSMSIGLTDSFGTRVGNFILYRTSASAPPLVDLEVFTTTGFSEVVSDVVEKLRDSWSAKARPENNQALAMSVSAPLNSSRVPQVVEAQGTD